MDFTIFLDMDGVLTDFDKRFLDIPENTERLTISQYIEKYGKAKTWNLVDNEGVRWWSEMEWIEGGEKLWGYLRVFSPIILSAPSRHKNSIIGKTIWVNENLNLKIENPTTSFKPTKWDPSSRMILHKDKYRFSERFENSILIDDTEKKIRDWEYSGGIGILHENTDQTISQLNQIIN